MALPGDNTKDTLQLVELQKGCAVHPTSAPPLNRVRVLHLSCRRSFADTNKQHEHCRFLHRKDATRTPRRGRGRPRVTLDASSAPDCWDGASPGPQEAAAGRGGDRKQLRRARQLPAPDVHGRRPHGRAFAGAGQQRRELDHTRAVPTAAGLEVGARAHAHNALQELAFHRYAPNRCVTPGGQAGSTPTAVSAAELPCLLVNCREAEMPLTVAVGCVGSHA